MKLLIKIEERLLKHLQFRKYKRDYKKHLELQKIIDSIIVKTPDEPVFKLKTIK